MSGTVQICFALLVNKCKPVFRFKKTLKDAKIWTMFTYIYPICYKQHQCTEGTVTYLGLVVQSRVRFNPAPGLNFNPLFYSSFSISVSFKITETKITIDAGKICKKYLEAYKQISFE